MAKELKELIYKYQAINCVNNHFANKDHILASIVCLPTIEAEPIKHGKWWLQKIPYKGGHGLTATKYRCSACRLYNNKKTNYCPNCGAKMDE